MADFNSKYTGAEVEAKLDKIDELAGLPIFHLYRDDSDAENPAYYTDIPYPANAAERIQRAIVIDQDNVLDRHNGAKFGMAIFEASYATNSYLLQTTLYADGNKLKRIRGYFTPNDDNILYCYSLTEDERLAVASQSDISASESIMLNKIDKTKDEILYDYDADEFIDLGLPSGTLWAKKNLGAEHDYDRGVSYMFGFDEGFVEGDSIPSMLSESELKSRGIIDSQGILNSEHDPAIKAGYGRTPSIVEINELVENTALTFENHPTSSRKVAVLTSKINGKSIRLFGGQLTGGNINNDNYYKIISSNQYGNFSGTRGVWCKTADEGNRIWLNYTSGVTYPVPVRPVTNKSTKFYTKKEVDALLENAGGGTSGGVSVPLFIYE